MNSLQVLIFCCLIYQSIGGGPAPQPSSSSSIPASTRPMCFTCRYIVTQMTSDFERTAEDCDPGTNVRNIITLQFYTGRPDLDGYCSQTNEPIYPSEWTSVIADYIFV